MSYFYIFAEENKYALSVRTKVNGQVRIRHFQIYQNANGFYIYTNHVFNRMNDLIEFYRGKFIIILYMII